MEVLVTGRGRKRSLLRRCAMKGTSPAGEGDVGASGGHGLPFRRSSVPLAEVAEFFVALVEEGFRIEHAEVVEVFGNDLAE